MEMLAVREETQLEETQPEEEPMYFATEGAWNSLTKQAKAMPPWMVRAACHCLSAKAFLSSYR